MEVKNCGVCGLVQTLDNSGVRRYNRKNQPIFHAYCRNCEADRVIALGLKRCEVEQLLHKRSRAKSMISLIEEELTIRLEQV